MKMRLGRFVPAKPVDREKIVSIDAAALRDMNDATLHYICSTPKSEIEARIKAVSFLREDVQRDGSAAAECLRKSGIVIVQDFLDSHAIDVASEAVSELKEKLDVFDGEIFEEGEFLIQGRVRKLNDYTAFSGSNKATANVRQGADQGMVDVFHVDKMMSDPLSVRQPFANDWILKLLATDGRQVEPRNLNLYLNRSVTATRGFHVDTFRVMLKGFVYLSDVTTLDDGPYTFVCGSHVASPWRIANQKIAEVCEAATEAPFVDPSKIIPVLAPKGSLVISDQSGVHRGLPQAEGAERMVLVMAYR